MGFLLSEVSSRLGRREERTHSERQRARDVQFDAARVLDEALRISNDRLPSGQPGTPETRAAAFSAHDAWQEGAFRALSLMRDDVVIDRYRAAGWMLLMGWPEEDRGLSGNPFLTGRAIRNARQGVGAFLLGEPPPPATFPSLSEAKTLTKRSAAGTDYEPLEAWLDAHPE